VDGVQAWSDWRQVQEPGEASSFQSKWKKGRKA